MGVLGLLSTGYVLAVGGDLNGPVIGAILSVAGFGGFGKHAVNCVPVVAGVLLATILQNGDPAASGILLAALFSTTLAPISGSFGWHWGIVAGAIHVSAAQTVGVLHGGLNLYNNGFAAGFVAALVAPVALALRAQAGAPATTGSEAHGPGPHIVSARRHDHPPRAWNWPASRDLGTDVFARMSGRSARTTLARHLGGEEPCP